MPGRLQLLSRPGVILHGDIFILNPQLAEFHGGELQLLQSRMTRNQCRAGCFSQIIEFGDTGLLLFLQLGIKDLGVKIIQPDNGRFRRALVNLSQTSTRGLEHHVGGAIPLLRQDHPGERPAIPPLLAHLHQQYDTSPGEREVKAGEERLTPFLQFVLLVAAMIFQDVPGRISSQLLNQPGDGRINLFFQTADAAAVDSQFGAGSGAIGAVPIGLVKITDPSFNNNQRLQVGGNLHPRFLQETLDSPDKRVVVNGSGNLRELQRHTVTHGNRVRRGQIRRPRITDNTVHRAPLAPPINHLTKLDVVGGCVVNLIDMNGKILYLADEVSQFIRLAVLLIFIMLDKLQLIGKIQTVQNHLLGIHHHDQTEQLFEGLMARDLL